MIDLHCHILSGIDDGAKTMRDSIEMCHIAQMNGIKHIVATPHTNTVDNIDRFLEVRNEKINALRDYIAQKGLDLNIYPGAEVYVDDDVYFSNNLKRLSINSSRYILVEFSFRTMKVRRIVDYLNEILKTGLIPIVAHPERYDFLKYDYDAVNMLSRNGVIFQINAASLASLDGRSEFELAYAMAYNGVASFIGTDAHSPRMRANNLLEMMRMFPPDISQFNMQMMVHDAAKCVLTDSALPVVNRGELYNRGF